MKRPSLPAALLCAALLAAPAAAQERTPKPASPPGSWGGLFTSLWLTTDYRYQGVSNSDNAPAIQGVIHYFRPDGWYAGLFTTQVDYGYAQSPDYELDFYAGKTIKLDAKTDLKPQVLVTVFPDNHTPGPTFDFIQGGASVIRKEGPLTLTALGTYVPNGSFTTKQVWRAEAAADYALTRSITVKSLAGHTWAENGRSRSYWSLGVAAKWRWLGFEARYQDTNLSRRQCGFNPDICGASVTGLLTADFPLILF
jgi:uncharacterized protein (TIGR02001 family)